MNFENVLYFKRTMKVMSIIDSMQIQPAGVEYMLVYRLGDSRNALLVLRFPLYRSTFLQYEKSDKLLTSVKNII